MVTHHNLDNDQLVQILHQSPKEIAQQLVVLPPLVETMIVEDLCTLGEHGRQEAGQIIQAIESLRFQSFQVKTDS